jgi:hypothetical protein
MHQAQSCVAMYGTAGSEEQTHLESAHQPLPSPVRTTDREMKDIMRRGSLNSLAHCSLIQAEAAERLGRFPEAARAYQETARLTYGRIYDEEARWFWSPAERAADGLRRVASSKP